MASFFPLLVFVATVALIVALIRLDRRLSRGALSAGPRHPARAEPPGLQQTPWELQAIDDQLLASHNHRARGDLTKTVNRLIQAAGIDDPARLLPPDASDQDIAAVISTIEQRLELPPLGPTPPTATDPWSEPATTVPTNTVPTNTVPTTSPHRLGSTDR